MEANLIAAKFEMDELYSKITSHGKSVGDEKVSAMTGRRLAMRLLVGDMDKPADMPASTSNSGALPAANYRSQLIASGVDISAGMGKRAARPPVGNSRLAKSAGISAAASAASPKVPAPKRVSTVSGSAKKTLVSINLMDAAKEKSATCLTGGGPMEEFFAIMEQFVDEPEEMEFVRAAEAAHVAHQQQQKQQQQRRQLQRMGSQVEQKLPSKRSQQPHRELRGSFDGFSAESFCQLSGPMMVQSPKTPKLPSPSHQPAIPSQSSSDPRVVQSQSLYERPGSGAFGNCRDLSEAAYSLFVESPRSKAAAGDSVDRFQSDRTSQLPRSDSSSSLRERRELESLVDALKAEVRVKDKLLEASEKGREAVLEELRSVWNHVAGLERHVEEMRGTSVAMEEEMRAMHVAAEGGSVGRHQQQRVGASGLVSELSRKLAAAEARNHELETQLGARGDELERTQFALQKAEQERNSLADEMEAALSSWAADSPKSPCPSCSNESPSSGRSLTSSHSSTSSSSGASSSRSKVLKSASCSSNSIGRSSGSRSNSSSRELKKANSSSCLRTSAMSSSPPSSCFAQTPSSSSPGQNIRHPMDPRARQVHFAETMVVHLPVTCSAPS